MVGAQARVVLQEEEAATCELVPRPASIRGLWLPAVVRGALSVEVSEVTEAALVEKLVLLVGTARKVAALGRKRVAAPAGTLAESTALVLGRLARAETVLRAVRACPPSAGVHSKAPTAYVSNHGSMQLDGLMLADFFCSGGGGGWYGGGSSGDGTGATAGGGSGYVLLGTGNTIGNAHSGAGYIDIAPITKAVRDHSLVLLTLLCLQSCTCSYKKLLLLCCWQPPTPSPPGPPPTPPACTQALVKFCDADRRKSAALCGLCAGVHQQQTQEAGCTNQMIANFCTNTTQFDA